MTASIDALTDQIADTIHTWLWAAGINGGHVAAMAIQEIPQIRAALAATRVLAELDRRHQWRLWADGVSRSCTCGAAACDVRELLDQARP